jgi:hypothetical protein
VFFLSEKYKELEAKLRCTAGTALAGLVTSWPQPAEVFGAA